MNSVRRLFRGISQHRCLHTTSLRAADTMAAEQSRTFEEIRIPVPWGYIAGKWWGDKNLPACIAVHGLLDNANSFDKLIPFLDHQSIFCIDLPGHGFSSHIPKGMSIYYPDYIIFLRYIIKHHLKKEKVGLIGHSYGSSLCYTYAALFPKEVEFMVNIDCSRLATAAKTKHTVSDLRKSFTSFLQIEDEAGITAIGYSWGDTIRHLYDIRMRLGMPLSIEGCEVIASRGIMKMGDMGHRFSFDSRLKERSIGRYTKNTLLAFARNISCPVLNIFAKDGLLNLKNSPMDPKEVEEHLNELKKYSSSFVNVTVDGFHHAHLDHPKNVAEAINSFLKNNTTSA